MTDQDAMDKSDRSTVATTKRSSQKKKKKKTKEPPGCLGKKQQLENTSSDTYHGSTKKLFSLAYSYLIFLRERALCVAGPQHRQLL